MRDYFDYVLKKVAIDEQMNKLQREFIFDYIVDVKEFEKISKMIWPKQKITDILKNAKVRFDMGETIRIYKEE